MSLESLVKEATEGADRDAEQAAVDASVRKVYRLINDNLESVGGIETAAGICGIDRGDLRRALDRKGRYLAVDHVIAIASRMRRFNAGKSTEVGASIVYPMGLCVFPRVEMTVEEENRRLKAKLNAIGQSVGVGTQLVEEALKTP